MSAESVEDLLGSYRLTPASIEQIRACHALYESQEGVDA